MNPHGRAVSVWYRTAGLASRNQKDLAVDILEAEIRSAQREVWLEAAKPVLTDQQPVEIARHLRDVAQRNNPAEEVGITRPPSAARRHRARRTPCVGAGTPRPPRGSPWACGRAGSSGG